jgi:hypothetical protein
MAYVPGELQLPDRLTRADFIRSLSRLHGGLDESRPPQSANDSTWTCDGRC